MIVFPEPEFRDRLIGRQDVAQLLSVTDRTLQNWAVRQFGPRPVVVGGAAIYDRAQVEAFRALAPAEAA